MDGRGNGSIGNDMVVIETFYIGGDKVESCSLANSTCPSNPPPARTKWTRLEEGVGQH